ncbi:hypothetical protein, partial [Mycobacterium tuberculosis]
EEEEPKAAGKGDVGEDESADVLGEDTCESRLRVMPSVRPHNLRGGLAVASLTLDVVSVAAEEERDEDDGTSNEDA